MFSVSVYIYISLTTSRDIPRSLGGRRWAVRVKSSIFFSVSFPRGLLASLHVLLHSSPLFSVFCVP